MNLNFTIILEIKWKQKLKVLDKVNIPNIQDFPKIIRIKETIL